MTREIRDRERVVRGAVNKIGGECTARRVAPTVSQLGLQNAGGAGADKYANALRAVFLGDSCYGIGKAVLQQTQQREPVVTAIKASQLLGKLHRIDIRDLTHKSCQIYRIKRARP